MTLVWVAVAHKRKWVAMTKRRNWLENMLMLPEKMWSYIKKVTARSPSWMQRPRKGQKSTSSNLYRRCFDTPLSVFISCVVDKNYNSLIKFGKCTSSDLLAAWDSLYSEYQEILGLPTNRAALNLAKASGKLHAQHTSMVACYHVLRHGYSGVCVNTLRYYGYGFRFDPSDKKGYAGDLENLVVKIRVVEMNIQRINNEQTAFISQQKGKDITRQYFMETLASLAIFCKFPLNPDELSVGMYALYQKKYREEAEASQKQLEKLKAKRTSKYNKGNV